MNATHLMYAHFAFWLADTGHTLDASRRLPPRGLYNSVVGVHLHR